ncbi:MAG: hypothetical protein J0H83_10465 [Candidatus Melainabacteria bacterium]|jgi:hypothetical protein|nr:hypothetical protein [Candidatus Melainabacteria bacterium]MBX9671991.1 hypothetical protein [Candidatus Obscuribacterales bacterium]
MDDQTADRMLKEIDEAGTRSRSQTYKHPMVIDLLLALGLLFAMGGLTVSFVRSYITHSANASIIQGNYKAAIGILRSSPIPEILGGIGSDEGDDLLNKALYLDALEKLDANAEDPTALQELTKISPHSRFYDSAQTLIKQTQERK